MVQEQQEQLQRAWGVGGFMCARCVVRAVVRSHTHQLHLEVKEGWGGGPGWMGGGLLQCWSPPQHRVPPQPVPTTCPPIMLVLCVRWFCWVGEGGMVDAMFPAPPQPITEVVESTDKQGRGGLHPH